jgi:hypothetical protein
MIDSTTESVRKILTKSVDRVFCKAYLSANQLNLTDSTPNKILLNTLDKDLGGNFDTPNNKFIAPVDGFYHIIGNIEFTATVADKRYITYIYKNGAHIKQAAGQAATTAGCAVTASDYFYLKANDEIELYGYPEAGASTVDVVGTGPQYTTLTVYLVSREGG